VANGWRTADQWGRLARLAPSEDAAAQMVVALLERWPTLTRSIVDRDRWQRMKPGAPKACQHCGVTMRSVYKAARYCGDLCKAKAAHERSQLRKTAGIIRR
jgi:hypothetical protein